MRYKIYLAGPDVFLENAIEIGEEKKKLCEKYDFIGIFPLDEVIEDFENYSKYFQGLLLYGACEKAVRESDIIIANLTPFRGVSADVGTVYEIGLGRGYGKKIYGYSNTSEYYKVRMDYYNINSSDPSRDNNKMQNEDFDMHDNLMIDGGIAASGGRFIVGDVQPDELYTDLSIFEKVIEKIKEDLPVISI